MKTDVTRDGKQGMGFGSEVEIRRLALP